MNKKAHVATIQSAIVATTSALRRVLWILRERIISGAECLPAMNGRSYDGG
jgi:hypothetical protein